MVESAVTEPVSEAKAVRIRTPSIKAAAEVDAQSLLRWEATEDNTLANATVSLRSLKRDEGTFRAHKRK